MASFRKYKTGWRAEVERSGIRESKTFATRREAEIWAAGREYVLSNSGRATGSQTLGDLFQRYADEVSPGKRGARWEIIRLKKFQTYSIARKRLSELKPQDFAEWRDLRLAQVQGPSVRRELQLMTTALNRARKEWGWIDRNPLTDVTKPRKNPRRDRLASADDLERLQVSAGTDLTNATARAFHAFLFGIETAMRASEILSLTSNTVDTRRRVADLPETKNGEPREVPLSSRAVALWEALPGDGFELSSQQLDALWRKVRDRAGVVGLNFHDSRHHGITKMAQKLEVLDLARAVGHKNLNQLLTYYEAKAEDLAKKLD